MVRRDQDGGHRSEKSGPKIPGFRAFVPTAVLGVFARLHPFIGFRSTWEAERSSPVRFLGDPRAGRTGDPSFSRGPRSNRARKHVWRRFVFVSPGLCILVASTSDGDTSSATRLMENKREKLEDLARLALKRLNISYLTISSRLVWFERETFVCVANANDEGNDARDSRSRLAARERLNFIRDRFSASRQTCRSSTTSKGLWILRIFAVI